MNEPHGLPNAEQAMLASVPPPRCHDACVIAGSVRVDCQLDADHPGPHAWTGGDVQNRPIEITWK